jgi:predicted transcriptional regulator
MDSKSFHAKVTLAAIIGLLIIGWSALTYSQSRQDSGPRLPESRLKVDVVDNTVKGVSLEDLQNKINNLETEIQDLKTTQVSLESRISSLETEQNR